MDAESEDASLVECVDKATSANDVKTFLVNMIHDYADPN